MLKFFRKYRNFILAVGGSILMVAFLLGSVINQLGNLAPSPVVARIVVDGSSQKVRLKDQQQAGIEIDMINKSFGPIIAGQLDSLMEYDDGDPDTSNLKNALHWYLLKIQAEQAGLQGGVGDAENFLTKQAAQMALFDPNLNGNVELAYLQLINMLRSTSRMSERDTLTALANFLAVERLINTYHGSTIPSDYRLKKFSKNFNDGLTVNAVLVDAKLFIDEEPEPELAAQQAHFEKYADVVPGEGEFGIGYRQTDRVKFEYLTVEFQSILDTIEVSSLDANLWFKEHQNDPGMLQPFGQNEPLSFAQNRNDIILAYRIEQAEARMVEVVNALKAKLLKSTRSLQRDGDYRTLPDDWESQRLSFPDLQKEVQAEFNVTLSYNAIGDVWVDVNRPINIGIISFARRAAGSQTLGLSEVLKSYRAFGNPEIASLQAGLVDFEPYMARYNGMIIGRSGANPVQADATFLRVVQADPIRPAANLEEVQEEVITDLKRIAVYERLKTEQDSYLTQVNELGVKKIAEDLDQRNFGGQILKIDQSGLGRGEGFKPSGIAAIGKDEAFSNLILSKGKTIDEIGDLTNVPLDQRTLVAPIPSKLGLAVAEITRKTPGTYERLASILSRQFSYKKNSDVQQTARYGLGALYVAYELDQNIPGDNPFGFEALSKRYQFEYDEDWAPTPEDETNEGLGTDSEPTEETDDTEDSK